MPHEPLSTRNGTFLSWYARHATGEDAGPCPLSADELIALDSRFESDAGAKTYRRILLEHARGALAGGDGGPEAAHLIAFNELRERLAEVHWRDEERPRLARLNEAVAVLLERVRPGDDLSRPTTRSLAAKLYEERGRTRVSHEDELLAIHHYVAAWKASVFPDGAADAFAAARLLRQHAAAKLEHAAQHTPPGDVAAWSDERRRRAEELTASAQQDQQQAAGLYTGLIDAAGEALIDAAQRTAHLVAPGQAAPVPASDAPGAWDATMRTADGLVASVEGSSPEALGATVGPSLDRLWQAALTLLQAHFAIEQWTEAASWQARLLDALSLQIVHGSPTRLQRNLSSALRDMLIVHAIRFPPRATIPDDGLAVLRKLLDHEIRESLSDWFRSLRPAAPAPTKPSVGAAEDVIQTELEALRDAVDQSRTFSLSDVEISALAHGVVDANRRGRIGLALSGGGFRASFFHLGVLARLADLDLLRSIEVVSCVSGGAIIGACYYLKLKALLATTHDAKLTKQHFVDLVASLADEFLDGVQRNIRTRVFTSPRAVFRLWFDPRYTRTQRVAELFASELFSRVGLDAQVAGGSLDRLKIVPFGEAPGFDAQRDNWRRSSKIPTFVINATSLNTGHNWQFTCATAGEPAFAVDPEVDATHRLRVFHLEAKPQGHRSPITLGMAVAASACVPGLFPPLPLPDVYDATLRLVDGGVFDNQGISALLDHGCDVMLVSDGSRQIDYEKVPKAFAWATLGRTNAILMERVRQLQFRTLIERRRLGMVRDLMFVHLTKGLEPEPVSWVGCRDTDEVLVRQTLEMRRSLRKLERLVEGQGSPDQTAYGISAGTQRLLATIRTDLDSFSQVEAYSLFASGYRLATVDIGGGSGAMLTPEERAHVGSTWRHARIWPLLQMPWPENRVLERRLEIARLRFFKVAKYYRRHTRALVGAIAAAMIVALSWWPGAAFLGASARAVQPQVTRLVMVFAVLAAFASLTWGAAVGRSRGGWTRVAAEYLQKLLVGPVLPFTMVASWIHLKWLDRVYLRHGAVDTADGRPYGPPL